MGCSNYLISFQWRTGTELDKDGSYLLKFSEELPPKSASPFVLAIEVDQGWVFELWCESSKLLGNMSLSTAIASFLHLAFVFDLKYPNILHI